MLRWRLPIRCEWESDVVAVVALLGGVAQVVCRGVKVVGVHGEEGQGKDEEVRVEVKGEVEEYPNFLRAFLMVSLNSLTSGSMK